MKKLSTQSGNVLFLILIAVALFAALSYAVTKSTRGGGNANSEIQQLDTAQMMQYASSVKMAVQRLKLINKCADNEFDFDHDNFRDNYYQRGDSAVRSDCSIFSSTGAGLPWVAPPESVQAQTGTSEFSIAKNVQFGGIGTYSFVDAGAKDLVYWVNVTQDMCIDINNRLGVENPGGTPPFEDGNITDIPPGNWQVYGDIDCRDSNNNVCFRAGGKSIGDGDAPELRGQEAGCVHEQNDDEYFFYQVLLAR